MKFFCNWLSQLLIEYKETANSPLGNQKKNKTTRTFEEIVSLWSKWSLHKIITLLHTILLLFPLYNIYFLSLVYLSFINVSASTQALLKTHTFERKEKETSALCTQLSAGNVTFLNKELIPGLNETTKDNWIQPLVTKSGLSYNNQERTTPLLCISLSG